MTDHSFRLGPLEVFLCLILFLAVNNWWLCVVTVLWRRHLRVLLKVGDYTLHLAAVVLLDLLCLQAQFMVELW